MGLNINSFGKKKNDKNIKLQEYAPTKESVAPTPGNNTPSGFDYPVINMNVVEKEPKPQEVIRGQSAPGASNEFNDQKKKKQTLKTLAMIVVTVIALLAYLAYEILPGGFFGGEGGTTALNQQSTDASQQAQLLKEREEMKQRLALAEHDRDEALSQIDSKVDERFKALMEQMPKTEIMSEDTNLTAQLKSLAESQAAIQQQLAALESNKKAEELKPREGSTTASITFNTLPAMQKKLADQEEALAAAVPAEIDFDTRHGLQMGTMIPAVLKTTMLSSMKLDRFIAVAETTQPVEIMSGFWLPAGVKFLGKPIPDMDARRIIVDVDRIQYKNADIKVTATMLDYRGNPGLVTKYIDPLAQAIWPSFMMGLAGATASAFQDMQGHYNANTGEYYEAPEYSAKNATLQGAANALTSVSNMMFQAQARKQPVVLVKAGIPIIVQITEKLTIDKLIEAGIVSVPRY